jgi:ABC-type bacteriocin/lantibiotic exporter with double-glycine peptidase domain
MYTSLSQNGGNISGGQKQRLLIARVLYKKPKVLILDEATSSLDVETELAIMEELKLLTSDITIIFITHRLTTLHYCNSVYQITEGSLSQFIP